MKFLAILSAVIHDLLGGRHWKRWDRQETIKAVNDELNRQIEIGEAASRIP